MRAYVYIIFFVILFRSLLFFLFPFLWYPMMNITRFLNPTRPDSFTAPKTLSISGAGVSTSLGDANCIETLLLHCANAIESNDVVLAQEIIYILNNITSPDGDSTQRLTSSFLRALISRAASKSPSLALAVSSGSENLLFEQEIHRFTLIELARFVDLTPWHRFGFIAANAAIVDAIDGYSSVHIVDLSLTHCMQIPTLIDSIANNLNKPQPLLKLTIVTESVTVTATACESPPPLLGISYEELGTKLVNFAATRNIAMEFRIISSSYSDGFSSLISQLQLDEFDINQALVVNCHMMLHYIPDETLTLINSKSLRSGFLNHLRDLNPTIVTLIDEDADFSSIDFISRLRSVFNYLWIPYDTADTFLTRGSDQRRWYEADIGWKIDNVVAKEGVERVERLEPKRRWFERMKTARFAGVGFGDAAAMDVKSMLEEHAAGWGMKRENDNGGDDVDHFVLTWKGHSVVFASAWVTYLVN